MPDQKQGKGRPSPVARCGPEDMVRRFHQIFGAGDAPRLFRAPARVNLIGEHTDYNDGFVMPAAIAFATWVAAAPRNDSTLAVHSTEFGDTRTFDMRAQAHPQHDWSDYVRGVAIELQQIGVPIAGANFLIDGNVPMGAGLSSSASLEVAAGLALVSLFGGDVSRRTLALLCQRAENEFVGARVGIMDQFASAHGRAGHALLLDCRSLDFETLPLPPGVALVICNTGVKHAHAGGEYNLRRRECEQGVLRIQERFPDIQALRDVTPAMLAECESLLPPVVHRRCRHVVEENARVVAAAVALREADLARFGKLMYASHASLRDDYEVSCPELDSMVEIAAEVKGVAGARMTGGGFGGCTVNLVHNDAVEPFRATVAEQYRRKTGITPQIYVTTASDGASEVLA